MKMRIEDYPKKMWRVLYPILIYIFSEIIVEVIFATVIEFRMLRSTGTLDTTQVLTEMSSEALQITLAFQAFMGAIAIFFYRKDLKRYKPMRKERSASMYVLVVIMGAAMCLTLNYLMNITGLMSIYEEDLDSMSEVLYGGELALEILSTVVVAPIAEETLFRGLIFKRLRTFETCAPSMVISALIFAIYHGNVLQGIYAFFIGLMAAYIYENYRSIGACMLFHAGANLCSVVFTECTALTDWVNTGSRGYGVMALSFVLTVGGLYIMMEYFRKKEEAL